MATCKLKEKGCFTDGLCHFNRECEHKVVTNADRIRAMSDEELAEFLGNWADRHLAWMCDSSGEVLCWLKQPAEEGKPND